nr:hypothetical protein GCM10020093_113990 [Planobispora longispora]
MPEKLHPNVEKVAAVLAEHGLTGEIVVFSEATPTAATAAAQLGCEVGAIANSLVFDADGEPLLVLTSGAHRVDTALIAETIGAAAVRRATPSSSGPPPARPSAASPRSATRLPSGPSSTPG